MSYAPFAVVSLVEILETSSEAWWYVASMTGQLLVRLERTLPPLESIAETLGRLLRECEKLELPLSGTHIKRINEYIINNDGISALDICSVLKPMIYELNVRVHDELQNRFFLVIPTNDVSLYRQSHPLFGIEVETIFPQISEDIYEAGKCISLGRYTASVFHLMRTMESAVMALGIKLGVTVIDKNNVDLERVPIRWTRIRHCENS